MEILRESKNSLPGESFVFGQMLMGQQNGNIIQRTDCQVKYPSILLLCQILMCQKNDNKIEGVKELSTRWMPLINFLF